jgi:hypothetical protein
MVALPTARRVFLRPLARDMSPRGHAHKVPLPDPTLARILCDVAQGRLAHRLRHGRAT